MKLLNTVSTPDGRPCSFYTYKMSFGHLCRCIATVPGVEFTQRPFFYIWGEDAQAEFRFKGREFKVETIWADTHVCPKDDVSAYPEIVEIEEHVEKHGHSFLRRVFKKIFSGQTRETPTPS